MIVVFGSLNIDMVMPVERFPNPGETVLCSADYLSRPGGKGANQAVAAARAGAKVAVVGKVGDDAFGRRCINNLKNHSIWSSGIGISERPTGCATIAVEPKGGNFVIAAPGANLDAASDQAPDEVFSKKNIVLTQMEVKPEETFSVLKRARRGGAITIFNAAPAGNVPRDVLNDVDYLIVNEIEAQQLGRALGVSETDPQKLALQLSALGKSMTAIITLEAQGCIAARESGIYVGPALKVEAIDTTGAGDAFCGIFAACLLKGHNWLLSLHRASVGASLSCLGLGAQGSMPTMDDIEAQLANVEAPHRIN